MNSIKLLVFFILISSFSYSQTVSIKRDGKTVELSKLKSLKIIQNKTSNGKDSINITTEVDSVYKSGDTLIVRPYSIEEVFQLDSNVNITTSKVYKEGTKSLVKIPISEIDKLTGKNRSLSRALSYVSTVAFLGVGASTVLRFGNTTNQQIGSKLFYVSAPTLIASWILQATLAKKKFYIDKSRTDKKTWIFN
ncbi:MAG: hypothetical protein IPJ60_17740 [Sphingobacteriaceae bacterium]|nr:hypothetical protein [Sphingobacteriaceae bacterium]